MKKWIIVAVYMATAGLLLLKRHSIMSWIHAESSWNDYLILFAIAFIIALVPAIPYGLIAALFGAKFGALAGSFINLGLSSMAAIVLFLIVRYAFNAEQRTKAAQIRGLTRLTAITESNPFLSVMVARLLPVIPAQAINVYAALTRMKMLPFAVATIVGKIPFMVATTLLGESVLVSFQWSDTLPVLMIYGVFLLFVALTYRYVFSKRANDNAS
ncbi:TVP38/TMEM64 family protein [Cohnella cholangitidis]|uniref:TVP38/TMEM64 family protein n=1 Tax=Cohnella cholangitidis TaxID=2598458 RepID=UPI0015F86B89|nr:VTT domain-containing protein [Cohnella cholangitidis]